MTAPFRPDFTAFTNQDVARQRHVPVERDVILNDRIMSYAAAGVDGHKAPYFDVLPTGMCPSR